MKKMMKYFAAAFVAIVAVSCVKEMDNSGQQTAPKMVTVTFGVDLDENSTKTSLGEVDGAPALLWSAGDKIAVLDSLYKGKYEFTLVSGAGTTSASFTGTVPEDALNAEKNGWCFVYPYEQVEKYGSLTNNGRHNINVLPLTIQEAVLNGFAPKAVITVGHTNNLMSGATLYNVSSYIKINIQGRGITSVTIFDNKNNTESGSGTAQIVPAKPSGSYMNGRGSELQSNKVVLVPRSGSSDIAEGTYYLSYRPGNSFAEGMTLKFTHSDGSVAYYSSSDDGNGNLANRNKTIDLGIWNASEINWKSKNEIVIDFKESNQPFSADLPIEASSVETNYTLSDYGRDCFVKVTGTESVLSNKGLLAKTVGDYIEFPIIPGKKLKEVQLYTCSGFNGTIQDASGNVVGGPGIRIYGENTYSYIIRDVELNAKYRLAVMNTDHSMHITTLKLIYFGEDNVEVTGVQLNVEGAFTGFKVTGNVLGIGLDASMWGIEYKTGEGDWQEGPSGVGATISELVEVDSGTYYVRAWASADNGNTKVYSSEDNMVIVKAFSGTITFDFSSESVANNITFVSTTSEGDEEFTSTTRAICGEDHYLYTTESDGKFPFTIYSSWDATNSVRKEMTYYLSTSGGLRGPTGYYWVSIPVVSGWKLKTVTYYTNNNQRDAAVVSEPTTGTRETLAKTTKVEPLVTEEIEFVMDVAEKSTEGAQYYLEIRSNGYNYWLKFEYDQVN